MKCNYISVPFLVSTRCSFKKMGGRVKNIGKAVGWNKNSKTFESCVKTCNKNPKCKSFIYGKNKKGIVCGLKDIVLTGSEPLRKKDETLYSAYKVCELGINIFFISF